MTTAYERTKAVIEARELLQPLASATGTGARRAVREAARQLFQHHPLDVDLEGSAAALPGIWAPLCR
ncbi:BPSL0761 family protein [Paraburkholderia sp. IMGN_8]|uniref:BPSL0761 family protein n=1 Tax=Paraburkholderia sp. IMGN_8 TaxID=3136564 RepID=UPI00310140BD